MSGLSFTVQSNGSLRITADSSARGRLADTYHRGGYTRALDALYDAARQAGYGAVKPEWIGALTDAPILGENVTIPEEGQPVVAGRVWWFRQYEAVDEMQELISKGAVVFSLGA